MNNACVIYGARDIRLEPRQSAPMSDTAVKLRVRAGGICGSDPSGKHRCSRAGWA